MHDQSWIFLLNRINQWCSSIYDVFDINIIDNMATNHPFYTKINFSLILDIIFQFNLRIPTKMIHLLCFLELQINMYLVKRGVSIKCCLYWWNCLVCRDSWLIQRVQCCHDLCSQLISHRSDQHCSPASYHVTSYFKTYGL